MTVTHFVNVAQMPHIVARLKWNVALILYNVASND